MSLTQRIFITACLLTTTGCFEDSVPARARQIQDWMYTGQLDSLTAQATPELRRKLEDQGGLERFYTRVVQELGPESEESARSVFFRGDVTHVIRSVRYESDPVSVRNVWIAFDPQGRIHNLSIRLAGETLCTSRSKPRICLRLPFEGEWEVLNGGPLREQNIHAMDPQQCYAVEWRQVKDWVSFQGSGERNSDYFAYGQPVLAPASGIVVAVENQTPENTPGTPNFYSPWGNYVVLDHHTGEFSVLGSLQPGSITAAVGDTIISGDVMGRCGNTGLSREPKIHLHLQSQAEGGQAKPMGFTQVKVNGERLSYINPITGQVLENFWLGSSRITD